MSKNPTDEADTLRSDPPVSADAPTLLENTPPPSHSARWSSGGDATLVATPENSGPSLIDLAGMSLDDGSGRDRYQATRLLGAGGMGEVHLCRDRRLGRDVALKMMHADLAQNASSSARFLREARIQGQLEHPSVVPVYDLGALPDGGVFFTMKRVRGVTLEHVLDALRKKDPEVAARFTQRRLLTAFSAVCLAVEYAHARGVIHRDLKPGNVMLGDFGEVNVLDWGIAKTVTNGEKEDSIRESQLDITIGETLHGSLLGTPGYMSPEQARGQIARLDARADVYALGAILFEILTLQKMNDAATTRDLLTQTLKGGGPARLEAGSDLPPELAAIYLKATELDLDARIASARELSDAIERFLDGDRDHQRRREMGEEHAARAADAATRAYQSGAQGEEARRTAMREVGRALALDPSHAGALRTLAELLTKPPADTPQEAKDEMAAAEAASWRQASKLAALRLGIWVAFGVVVVMYSRQNFFALCAAGFLLAACASVWWLSRQERPQKRVAFAFLVLISIATAMLSGAFGPLFLVPSLAATNTMFFALNADRRHRWLVIVFGLASIAIPVGLDVMGVSSAPYSVVQEGILIHARVMEIGRGSLMMLFAMNLSIIITTSLMVSRVRDALSLAEKNLFLQAWQLKQLVPEEARPASSRNPRVVLTH